MRRLPEDWATREPSLPPPSTQRPPRPVGDPLWSAVFGAISGAVGGAAMLVVARTLGRLEHIPGDFADELAHRLTPSSLRGVGSAELFGLASVMVIGALVGILLGLLTRHLSRIFPRIVFFALSMPILWILLQAFLIPRLSPALAKALPVVPMSVGLAVYGLCLAVARPVRAR